MFDVGDRIELISMTDDPSPLPSGSQGTITDKNPVNFGPLQSFIQYSVKWDNGRTLMLCVPPDRARRI